MDATEFFNLWRQSQGKAEQDQRPLCPIAAEFLCKLEDTLFEPLRSGGITSRKIAQAKYMLQEEYHHWRKSVPVGHYSDLQHHQRCLADVYDAAYDRLHLMELTARPPTSLILIYDEVTKPAPPPPPPPAPQIAGIFLGEIEEK